MSLVAFNGRESSTLGPVVELVDSFAYRFDYIASIGNRIWFRSNLFSSKFEVRVRYEPQCAATTQSDFILTFLIV
jgi:hypothetical protein